MRFPAASGISRSLAVVWVPFRDKTGTFSSVPLASIPLPPWLVAVAAGVASTLIIAPTRRRKRRDKGLPTGENLDALASTYLDEQAKHWPDLVGTELLPRNGEGCASNLATLFKHLFTGQLALDPHALTATDASLTYAIAYLRYSDDNSNARSLDQQLINVLRRAKQDDYFIPWPFVFADAAVTGRHVDRQGYQLAKQAIAISPECVKAVIFDEISRTNRYCIEALRLGDAVDATGRFLLGATDGFDSRNEHSRLILSIFGAIYEHFSTQLGLKVGRGMRFAFGEGDVIGKVPVGYRHVQKLDAEGRPVLRNNGLPKHVHEIAPETAEWVRTAFELYVEKRKTLKSIQKLMNRNRVGGTNRWTSDKVRKMLRRTVYVGVLFYNKTRQVVDRETGTAKVIDRPDSEWLRKDVPHLRIVTDELFEGAQQRLKEAQQTYAAKAKPEAGARQNHLPVALIPLMCGYCGARLTTSRGGKYRSHSCPNGRFGKADCKLDSSKSDAITNKAILGYVADNLFGEEEIRLLVRLANEHLREMAAQPTEDLSPLRSEVKALQRKVNRLVDQLEDADEDRLPAVKKRLSQRHSELNRAKRELQHAEAIARPVPPEIGVETVLEVLKDLPAFLQEDVAAVAPVVGKMLGPVKIKHEREKGRRGAKWFAEFTVNHVPVLLELTRRRDCPSADTWEYLHSREWTTAHADPETAVSSGKTHRIEVQKVPDYERFAPVIGPLHAKGVSVTVLGTKYGLSGHSVYAAIEFFESGKRPKYKPKRKSDQPRQQSARPMVYKKIARDVVDRCDKGQSLNKIARELGVHVRTIQRAYDYLRPQDTDEAVAEGRRMKRQVQRSKFPTELKERVRSLHRDGNSPVEIVDITGVSLSSVRRILNEKPPQD